MSVALTYVCSTSIVTSFLVRWVFFPHCMKCCCMMSATVEVRSHGHVAVAIAILGYGLTDAQLIKL